MGNGMTTNDTHPEIVLVGPFWTRTEAVDELGCTDDCLLARNDVLRIGARLSEEVYPAFQFEHHHVREEIADIVALLLRGDVTGAVIADWLVEPNPDLGGKSPLKWLERDQPMKDVLEAARRAIPTLQAETSDLRSHNLPYPGHYGPDS